MPLQSHLPDVKGHNDDEIGGCAQISWRLLYGYKKNWKSSPARLVVASNGISFRKMSSVGSQSWSQGLRKERNILFVLILVFCYTRRWTSQSHESLSRMHHVISSCPDSQSMVIFLDCQASFVYTMGKLTMRCKRQTVHRSPDIYLMIEGNFGNLSWRPSECCAISNRLK